MCNVNLKKFMTKEYQQKRKLRVFQSYKIDIDSYPHFGEEGKIQGGVETKNH